MAHIRITSHLLRFFPNLKRSTVLEVHSIAEAIEALNELHPGLRAYIVNEHGVLRKHVNIFVDNEMIHDRTTLSDPVGPDTHVHIMQALSGGL